MPNVWWLAGGFLLVIATPIALALLLWFYGVPYLAAVASDEHLKNEEDGPNRPDPIEMKAGNPGWKSHDHSIPTNSKNRPGFLDWAFGNYRRGLTFTLCIVAFCLAVLDITYLKADPVGALWVVGISIATIILLRFSVNRDEESGLPKNPDIDRLLTGS